jgi:hypothetical protein
MFIINITNEYAIIDKINNTFEESSISITILLIPATNICDAIYTRKANITEKSN